MSNITTGLWITLIGMGLVFIALLVLWGLMELVMKIMAWYNTRNPEEKEDGKDAEAEQPVAQPALAPSAIKQKAAAAAVAAALALGQVAASLTTQASSGLPAASNWQAAMRGAQLNQRSFHFTRKNRGNDR